MSFALNMLHPTMIKLNTQRKVFVEYNDGSAQMNTSNICFLKINYV